MPGKFHGGGHDTEVAAAFGVHDLTGQRAEVLEILRQNPNGLTDDEGAEKMGAGMDRLKFGRRRNELVDLELAAKTDERRPTPRGKSAIVWRAL